MELRRCDHAHFIQALRGGSVIKVSNTSTCGRPGLTFKALKDVYGDATPLRQPPIKSRKTPAGPVFDYKHVKCEVSCLPMVDRTVREVRPETDEFVPHYDGLDNDLDDGTTLRQLKYRFLRKKRKFSRSDEDSNLAYADENSEEDKSGLSLPMADKTLLEVKYESDEFVSHSDNGLDSDLDDDTTLKQLKERFHEKKRKFSGGEEHFMLAYSNDSSVENESYLNEPIIKLKTKNSRRSKNKRKSMQGSVGSSSTTALNGKSKLNRVSEGSQQVGGDLATLIDVKVEDDADELESTGNISFCSNEVPSPSSEVSRGIQNIAFQLELRESQFSAEEYQNCVTNEISYDHLEDIEPISVFAPSYNTSHKVRTPELHCHEFLDLPPLTSQKGKEIVEAHREGSPSDGQNSDAQMLSRSSSTEEISEQSSTSDVRVLEMATHCTIGCIGLRDELDMAQFEDNSTADLPHGQDNSPSIPNENCSSIQTSVTSLKTDDSLGAMTIPDGDLVTCTLDDTTKNGLNCETNMKDELLKTEERQASASPITNAESQSSPDNQSFGNADTISTTEPGRPPERLLSTRKAISPSSQEQLCWAMNSVELSNDVDQYISSERKGRLCEGETGKKASSARSNMQHTKTAVNNGGHGQVSQKKVYISSRHMIKKSQSAKANLEGPRFTRILPNLSTECASIQGCSESAIAFSERQMQGMESLALKLMDELNSMKCIVEQKLLFEAYRNVSLKSDADEVKSAINSATKMEETARKWLSIMARDCKRFCKIMKMTPNGSPTSKDGVPRDRRKIMFADEAGGQLCQVNFFEAGVAPPVSDSVKQQARSIQF